MSTLQDKIQKLYPDSDYRRVEQLIAHYQKESMKQVDRLNHKSVCMITYGDSISQKGVPSAAILHKFADEYLKGIITDIHILPMFRYSSDDGFSVIDYLEIDPSIGSWDDIGALGKEYRLIFDFVANHVSKHSRIFQGYVDDEPEYRDFFLEYDEAFDYSKVVRPRLSPLFHKYRHHKVWTTFSEDQIDLNIKNFEVFLYLTEILLIYIRNGATTVRLDAIGYLWKDSGSRCLSMEGAHEIIKIWRLILDQIQPNCNLLVEANVPHAENVRYLGDGDEADMIYQFALPPLVLYTFIAGNAAHLTQWAKTIDVPGDGITYFNFLSSHDGIGIRPVKDLLSAEEQQQIIDRVVENGGEISYGRNPDGSESIYELNINYHSALVNQAYDQETQLKMILAANAILFSVVGIPAIYYNSLLGSGNDYEGYRTSGIKRRINREKFEYEDLCKRLECEDQRKKIFDGLRDMIRERQKYTAFDPYAEQTVADCGTSIFSVIRHNPDTDEKVQLFVNVTKETRTFGEITLSPYEYRWVLLQKGKER